MAIDIGKAFHAVLVECPDGTHQRFRMANSAEDYGRLVAFLRTLPGTVRVALEPTGNFHRTLAYHLISAGRAKTAENRKICLPKMTARMKSLTVS